MATTMAGGPVRADAERSERWFFAWLAAAMALVIVVGFSLQLGMGRSTFAVPLAYHVHAVVFFAWVLFYVAQGVTIARGNVSLHRQLGRLAWFFVPAMVLLGTTIMIVVLRRNGGPFFFDQNQFLFGNVLGLLSFAGLTFAALLRRRFTGWHRRFMVCGMAYLTGPGIGRILPMPLLVPNAWNLHLLVLLLFPVAGMVRDKLRRGAVHPAWYWGVAALVIAQALANVIAYSPIGIDATAALVAGTPGADRPMEAFLPPELAM